MSDFLDTTRDFGLRWLNAAGPDADIVLSTRVRLARNLARHPMPGRATGADRERVVRELESVMQTTLPSDAVMVPISDLDDQRRLLLWERRVITRELTAAEDSTSPVGAAVILIPGEPVTVMVNEEDHLRLQCLMSGLCVAQAWDEVDDIDTRLGLGLRLAFRRDIGFLTACPTNTGTGLRASALLHLPGLVLTREIERVLRGITQVGLTFRGLYGEGSEVVGNLVQVSNQTTLGVTEEETVLHLERVIGTLLEKERHARDVLMRDADTVTRDKVSRAYGLLRHAHVLTYHEMVNLLSGVRMGVSMGILSQPSLSTLNKILILAQAGHLQDAAGRTLSEQTRRVERAAYVRGALADDERPALPAPPRDSDS